MSPTHTTSKQTKMGFAVERFQGEVEEDLICPFCNKVLQEPVAGKCGHTFCKECLDKYLARRREECPVCQADLSKVTGAQEELVGKLEKLSLHCTNHESGCDAILDYYKLTEHLDTECILRSVSCRHKNCPNKVPQKDLEAHMEKCDYRLVECKVCKVCLPRKDMPAHQAVKRCFEELNKRRMVKNTRRISQELREHQAEITHHRHLTEQTERSLLRSHYFQDRPHHQRAMSAGPVLMRSSIEARVGSAVIIPHYSRTLKSAVIDTCMDCTNKFTHGRHPSARRHSHVKPCDHCQTWRMWNGPRGWASVIPD